MANGCHRIRTRIIYGAQFIEQKARLPEFYSCSFVVARGPLRSMFLSAEASADRIGGVVKKL